MFALLSLSAFARDVGMHDLTSGEPSTPWALAEGVCVTLSLVGIVLTVILFFSRK